MPETSYPPRVNSSPSGEVQERKNSVAPKGPWIGVAGERREQKRYEGNFLRTGIGSPFLVPVSIGVAQATVQHHDGRSPWYDGEGRPKKAWHHRPTNPCAGHLRPGGECRNNKPRPRPGGAGGRGGPRSLAASVTSSQERAPDRLSKRALGTSIVWSGSKVNRGKRRGRARPPVVRKR